MNSIFDYLDYRTFLADYYRHQKDVSPHFSHRSFLAKAGMSGPNFLKNIIDGKRNLSSEGIDKFAHALDLPARESHYFADLVKFNQSKTLLKKRFYYDRLSRFLQRSNIHKLHESQYDYFSHWYNVAVREYLNCHKFREDFETLANCIRPKISIAQAKKAVALLESLNLISISDDGFYKLTDAIVTTGPDVASLGALEYHKTMMDLGKKALTSFTADQRYIRSITGSFSEETFEKVKSIIDGARKQILDIINSDNQPQGVYQIGMQLFPLSSTKKGPKQ